MLILGTANNRLYKCVAPVDSTYVNDPSSNVIYLVTCKRKLHYVGKTSQNLNKRFNWQTLK